MFVKEECIYLGRITRTHGIHGQLVLKSDLELTDKQRKEPILINIDGGLVPFFLTNTGITRRNTESYFIHMDHLHKIEDAEVYVGCEVYLENCQSPKDQPLKHEKVILKNYSIYDSNNCYIGKIDNILDFSGNIVVRVLTEDKEILLPFTDAHIISRDDTKCKIHLKIPDGLINIY